MNSPPPTALKTAPPPAPPVTKTPQKSSGSRWVGWIILLIIAAAAWYFWPQIKNFVAAPAPATGGSGKGKGKGGGVTPVVAARARKGDISIYYTGLGAVTPIYTVTVKSRVDGQLMKVYFKEGELVHQGDPLIEIDPRPYQAALDQAQGQLVHDEALLKNAHVDLDRYTILLKQEAIPEQTYATQDALVKQYEGNIKIDQAQIDTAKLNVTYSHITSPITGIVGLRLVDPGNIVHATDTNGMVVLTQVDPISVIFTVAEDQLPPVLDKFHAGQTLPVEAWDRDLKNKLADGTLATIDNQIDPTTGTLRLRANFDNKANKLFPSQFVNARLLVDRKHNVTLVDDAAIQRNSQNTYVWLVKPDNTVTIRPVTTGAIENGVAEVTGGLDPGEEVVMVGVDKLQEGSRVNPQVAGEKPQGGNGAGGSGKGRGKKGS
jgi:membrane fusion protein, multidrug efflux system